MRPYALSVSMLLLVFTAAPTHADLILGTINDFETGTVEGWTTNTAVGAGGPPGSTSYLEIGRERPQLASFTTTVAGTISPLVTAIEVDMFRPAGVADTEIRLVLFGPTTSSRWTSTISEVVPGDGGWRRYRFSILEQDLTRVSGTTTYSALTAGLERMMIRYDPGAPSATELPDPTSGAFLGIDNVTAVPEPSMLSVLGLSLLGCLTRRRRG